MRDVIEVLQDLKLELSNIEGVSTCKIGIEHTIKASDYPIIRITPVESERSGSIGLSESSEVFITIGVTGSQAVSDVEPFYVKLGLIRKSVIEKLSQNQVIRFKYKRTLYDQDTLKNANAAAIYGTVRGI